jgi:2-phospho-L-lactate transferase/gluconeogenesis factor (CofD/UPF0052 family)
MTEPGETDGLTAADHLLALQAHVPHLTVHDMIVNDGLVPEPVRQRYAADGAEPLAIDAAALERLGCRTWTGDVLAPGDKVRHDPDRLARAVLEVARQPRPGRRG